ncbi:hypothetical protein [Mucilaginibacter aquariorum]|uniref:Uncharacterized protein n=1 Tax=Mucilaginibacter aquariorum TaxID=2967225 RepID=A0ABT1T936_9SPHI|nr:hypothetical protein [Mucilaginibacter aquariorum]MCQ6961128.1 hypothetical protein [Mucilaginibacter aquariorum]
MQPKNASDIYDLVIISSGGDSGNIILTDKRTTLKIKINMKKFKTMFLIVFSLFAVVSARAQTKDYYPGKWDVMVYGTPYGDVKLTFALERKDGKLSGVVQDSTGKETAKITKIDEKEKEAIIAYTTQGYDVELTIDPVDDDNVKGNLAGFTAKGVRRKENK